jgi:hypothetical protein
VIDLEAVEDRIVEVLTEECPLEGVDAIESAAVLAGVFWRLMRLAKTERQRQGLVTAALMVLAHDSQNNLTIPVDESQDRLP